MEELKEGEVINCLARPFCIANLHDAYKYLKHTVAKKKLKKITVL
jgi:hypothetical protein